QVEWVVGHCGRFQFRRRLAETALLEFLAAAAGTWIVTADIAIRIFGRHVRPWTGAPLSRSSRLFWLEPRPVRQFVDDINKWLEFLAPPWRQRTTRAGLLQIFLKIL